LHAASHSPVKVALHDASHWARLLFAEHSPWQCALAWAWQSTVQLKLGFCWHFAAQVPSHVPVQEASALAMH
jgi:hypothetical protein